MLSAPTPSTPNHPRSRFQSRNPASAAFDRQKGGAQAALPTVTRQFIDTQMEAMRNGTSEVAAYAATRNWLLGNGPRLFAQLDVPAQVRSVVAQTPASLASLRASEDQTLVQQFKATQELLASLRTAEAARSAVVVGASAGAFRAREAAARRALSSDPQLPRRPSGQD